MRAYNELVSRILHDEDREKFEYSVGAMLVDGAPMTTVIQGPPRSGKTTLTTIVRRILSQFRSDFSPRIAFLGEGIPMILIEDDTHIFYESVYASGFENVIIVRTSGGSIPVNTYHVLMRQINDELGAIAATCIHVFQERGPFYFQEIKENI